MSNYKFTADFLGAEFLISVNNMQKYGVSPSWLTSVSINLISSVSTLNLIILRDMDSRSVWNVAE